MAEYIYIPEQTVEANQGVLLNGSSPCPNGQVLHSDGSALFTLRGPGNGQCFARYQITFVGNIAVPEGGTVEEISLSIARSGEILGQSLSAITPAAVNQYGNVTSTTYINVPRGCCFEISVRNSSNDQAILVRNANLVITRIA